MPADKALVNYIRDALTAGAGFQQIRDTLKTQDWSDAAIDAAMAEATKPVPGKPIAPGALAAPLPPFPPAGGWQPAPETQMKQSAPFGFAFAFAGGAASLVRVLGTFAGAANPLSAAFPLVLAALFGVLILLSSLLLKKGRSMGGLLALALSLVLALFASDVTLQLPALLGVLGGALGLAKQ